MNRSYAVRSKGYIAYHCGSDTKGNKVKAVSLMDGGVYDNQGTDSVAIALTKESDIPDLEKAPDDRRPIRLQVRRNTDNAVARALIISDTPILNDNIYPAPDPDAESRDSSRLTLGHINMMALTFSFWARQWLL